MSAEIRSLGRHRERRKAGALLPKEEWLRLTLPSILSRLWEQGADCFGEACNEVEDGVGDNNLAERMACLAIYEIFRDVVSHRVSTDNALTAISAKLDEFSGKGQVPPA